MTWAESLQAATEREEAKWSTLLPGLDLAALDNWALLQLFDSNYAAPASESGREAFALLRGEIRARLAQGRIDQSEISGWGISVVEAVER